MYDSQRQDTGDSHYSIAISALGLHLCLYVRKMGGESKPHNSPSAARVQRPQGTAHETVRLATSVVA